MVSHVTSRYGLWYPALRMARFASPDTITRPKMSRSCSVCSGDPINVGCNDAHYDSGLINGRPREKAVSLSD